MDHDHDHDHGSGSGSGSKTCPMIMTFHAGHCETILWSGWVASTVTEFTLSAIALFLLALLYETLKFVRERMRKSALRNEALQLAQREAKTNFACTDSAGNESNTRLAELREKTFMEQLSSRSHQIQTLLNLVQIVISYVLMLVFMTFNYWLCLAVVLGLGLGYYLFGWIKMDVYENECCS